MATYQRVKVIINPAAGKAEPVLAVLNDVFGPADIEWDVAITHKSGDGVSAARQAIEQGFDLVGVYGGDGGVAEVASALVDGGPPMLLLPGGTGNALADDLGIPPALADAAALAIGKETDIRQIDLGKAGDRYFALRLTMGIETAMMGSATREMKDRFGWIAYAIAGLQALSNPEVAKYTVTVDGVPHEVEGVAAMVANSASVGHFAGVKLARDIDISSGLLAVVVVDSAALPHLLGSAAAAVQGQEPGGLSRWAGTQIRVEAIPPQVVLADGEEAGSTPIDVTVLHKAVRVLVPKIVSVEDAT